jgi:hypothetical protein
VEEGMSILTAPLHAQSSDSLPLRAAMVLDLATVQTMATNHAGNPVGEAAAAWLGTYNASLLMGLGEVQARRWAAIAWDASNDGPEVTVTSGCSDNLKSPFVEVPQSSTAPDRRQVVTPAGRAWLKAYDLARSLGFSECVAQAQAFAAAEQAWWA